MTEPDDDLRAFFDLDVPPANDLAFVLGVARAMQRRRFMVELASLAVTAVAAAAILWACGPILLPMLMRFRGLAEMLTPAAAVLVGLALLFGGSRPGLSLRA